MINVSTHLDKFRSVLTCKQTLIFNVFHSNISFKHMLFHSIQFLIFFCVVYGLYRCLPFRFQNLMLLAASYIFYGSWDWRFLSLIVLSTGVDYICGLKIAEASEHTSRRRWLLLSLSMNLGVLGFFKYFNFFTESLMHLFDVIGIQLSLTTLNIVLPVGISFYTFQTMSYTIDIYRGDMRPTRNIINFALFVAFFPQLVAGPIERAKQLLPQLSRPRPFCWKRFYGGAFLIYWGLFQKVFISDNLAPIVDTTFAQGATDVTELWLALYAFSIQIYCDFAGYSNMARGLAKLLDIDLMINFQVPYVARGAQDFWRRWHISLSTFLKDYLYIPLGGNRHGGQRTHINLMVTMILGGLWHGAAWNFVLWGFYQGLLLVGERMMRTVKRFQFHSRSVMGVTVCVLQWLVFYHLVCYGWMLFRAQSWSQIDEMTRLIVSGLPFNPSSVVTHSETIRTLGFFVFPLLIMDAYHERVRDHIHFIQLPILLKSIVYFLMYYLLIVYGFEGGKEFIYFQF
jgi:alginate O-acetyltransferase complex protein AlgI